MLNVVLTIAKKQLQYRSIFSHSKCIIQFTYTILEWISGDINFSTTIIMLKQEQIMTLCINFVAFPTAIYSEIHCLLALKLLHWSMYLHMYNRANIATDTYIILLLSIDLLWYIWYKLHNNIHVCICLVHSTN